MAFANMAYLAMHPGFRDRVRVAMIAAAIDVGAEEDDGSEYRRLRRAHAVNVLTEQDKYAVRYAWVVAANPAVNFDSPDDALQFTVNSRWDAVAGASQPTP